MPTIRILKPTESVALCRSSADRRSDLVNITTQGEDLVRILEKLGYVRAGDGVYVPEYVKSSYELSLKLTDEQVDKMVERVREAWTESAEDDVNYVHQVVDALTDSTKLALISRTILDEVYGGDHEEATEEMGFDPWPEDPPAEEAQKVVTTKRK
jgi:DNA-binding MarR family transcriptional regulator